jgi:hypothetical protein
MKDDPGNNQRESSSWKLARLIEAAENPLGVLKNAGAP